MGIFSFPCFVFLYLATVSAAPNHFSSQFEWELPKDEKTWNAIREYEQCNIDLIDELSKEFGENKMWPKYHPKFQVLMRSWNMCNKGGDQETVFTCNKKEAKTVFELKKEYLNLVEFENRQVFDEFFERKLEKCYYGKEKSESLIKVDTTVSDEQLDLFNWEPPKNYPWPKYYQCYIDQLGQLSEVNGMHEIWEKYRSKLQVFINRWECPGVTNQIDFEICNKDRALPIYKLVKVYSDILFTKFPQLKEEFLQKQAKCFAIIPKEL